MQCSLPLPCLQWRRISQRQAEPVLPRAKAFGELSAPIQRYRWCYLSTPLGTHLEQEDPPQEVLRAMAEVAEALARLQAGFEGCSGLLHRWVGWCFVQPCALHAHVLSARVTLTLLEKHAVTTFLLICSLCLNWLLIS